jgi:hypothetical protein
MRTTQGKLAGSGSGLVQKQVVCLQEQERNDREAYGKSKDQIENPRIA